MTECAVQTGILFSRKRCAKPATIHCGRCEIPLCMEHVVQQQSGPFLCPQCDRYENDGDHDWEYSEGGWRWRGARDSDDDDAPAAGPGAPAAVPAVLDAADREGFAADEGARAAAGAEADGQESDFDAS
jgi:hypothetical protein